MPGPEQHRDTEQSKEGAQQQFIKAAIYEQEGLAAQAYFQIQAVVFQSDCDLSVYRFKLSDVSHVAVLGATPPSDFHQQLDALMQHGAPTDLPKEIAAALFERRARARKLGPWVELHHRPGTRLD